MSHKNQRPRLIENREDKTERAWWLFETKILKKKPSETR